MKEFTAWIRREVEARGWSLNELSRRASVSYGTLQAVLKTGKGAGPKFCRGIARAFGLTEEEVFRRAGLLAPLREDATLREIYEVASSLSKEQRLTALKVLHGLKATDFSPQTPSKKDEPR